MKKPNAHSLGPPQTWEGEDRSGTLPLSAVSQRKTIPGLGVGREREEQRQVSMDSGKQGHWAGHQQAGFQGWCTKPAMGRSHPVQGIRFLICKMTSLNEELFGAPSSSSILEFSMKGREETEGARKELDH